MTFIFWENEAGVTDKLRCILLICHEDGKDMVPWWTGKERPITRPEINMSTCIIIGSLDSFVMNSCSRLGAGQEGPYYTVYSGVK